MISNSNKVEKVMITKHIKTAILLSLVGTLVNVSLVEANVDMGTGNSVAGTDNVVSGSTNNVWGQRSNV